MEARRTAGYPKMETRRLMECSGRFQTHGRGSSRMAGAVKTWQLPPRVIPQSRTRGRLYQQKYTDMTIALHGYGISLILKATSRD